MDLLLIHQPFGDYYGTYRAMEEAVKNGKARSIGVSNFYPDRYLDIVHFANIKPAVNQVETHIFQQQKVAKEYMKKYGTHKLCLGDRLPRAKTTTLTHLPLKKSAKNTEKPRHRLLCAFYCKAM